MPRQTLLRAAFGLAAALALAAAVFIVNLVWFRPFSLDLFYEKVFVTFALDNPETLTAMGMAEQFGYRRHNAHLDDLSIAKGDRDFARLRQNLAELKAYDLAAQTPSQQLSTRVLTWFLENQIEGERFRFHDYPVDQLWGVQNQTPDFLINQHVIADRRGAEDFLARLGEVGRKYDQVIEGLNKRQQIGVVPPRFVVEHVLAGMRAFADHRPAENPLCQHLASEAGGIERRARGGQVGAAGSAARRPSSASVVPAYRRLIAFFEQQLPRATTDDGVWKLPDGDAYYASIGCAARPPRA